MGQHMILRFTVLHCVQNLSILVSVLINIENVPLSHRHQIWIDAWLWYSLETDKIRTDID